LVGIAIDVAGRTPVRFAGRHVIGTSGAARIAMRTGTPVAMLTAHDSGGPLPRLEVSEPLVPSNYPDADALLIDMLRHHERAVLAWPEASDRPAQRWHLTGEDVHRFPPTLIIGE